MSISDRIQNRCGAGGSTHTDRRGLVWRRIASIAVCQLSLIVLLGCCCLWSRATLADTPDQTSRQLSQPSVTSQTAVQNPLLQQLLSEPMIPMVATLCACCALVAYGLQLRKNVQLRRAVAEAEQASHAKSQFLAQMSHELRTPMTGIIGFTDCLLDSLTEPEQVEFAGAVKRNSEHLLRIVNEILDLAHVESGNLIVEPVRYSPRRVLEQTVQLLRVLADDKGVQLVIRTANDLPSTVMLDPGRVRQVLLNVVGNAIKFTDCGSVELNCSFQQETTGDHTIFTVRDSGTGISPEDSGRIFHRFIQAEGTSACDRGGNGLGLAISQELVHLMGGQLTVDSEVNAGSTFMISLPTPDPQWETALPKKSHFPAGNHLATRLDGHILVVDDCADNRSLLQHLLKRIGLRVTVADHGLRALKLLKATREQTFDLMLMDMQMPVMDGYTAVRQAREMGYQLPVIAVTANAMSNDRVRCLDAGCDDYLTKPINRHELAEVLKRNLNPAVHRPTRKSGRRQVVS